MIFSKRLAVLRSSDSHASLQFIPQSLSFGEVVTLILIFIGRQLLHVFGLGPTKSGSKQGKQNVSDHEMPELSLSMPFRVETTDIDRYAKAIGITNSEEVVGSTAHTCLMLAALSMPAMLLLLAHHKSIILPLGSVNVRNKFELLRPDLCSRDSLFDLKQSEVRSKLLRETRMVKRGIEIDLLVEVVTFVGEKPISIFRQIFTMLQFVKNKKGSVISQGVDEIGTEANIWTDAQSVPVKLSAEDPKVWAAICKDYNPIHISSIAAKLFGFPSKISHGNFALAAGLAQVSSMNKLPQSRPLMIEVQYRRPVSLPARLTAQSTITGSNSQVFRLLKGDKVCVAATLVA